MTVRVVVVTTLLISAFAVEWLFNPAQSLRPLFLLAAASYGAVLAWAIVDPWLKGTRLFTYLQLLGDVAVITLFVQITGGSQSPMSFLYLLPISVASMLLYRQGALTIAGICFAAYAVLVLVDELRRAGDGGGGRIAYLLVSHLLAMLGLALLSAYLTERLRRQNRELLERRGAVARLQAVNENIIESINSGLITTDPVGRIQFINRGGMEITDLTQADVAERSVFEVLGLEPEFLDEIRHRLLARRRFRFERWFDTKTGRRIFLGIAVSNLYDKAGQPLGYILIFQDLTEIQALEREVRLQERMSALGQMAAGMAHELRNPLASISGAVQYLKGEYRPTGEALELMDIILRESERLDQAIRDFLTFTRPGEFTASRVDLVPLLEDCAKLLRKSGDFGSAHRIDLAFDGESMVCEVDRNRLKQVFWNLATNAVKAMPAGGRLEIAACWCDEDSVEIRFQDDGVGMSEREQQLYFQPFSSSFREGTGLGAAIVYRLVEEHGGRIRLTSEEERGTCVTIRLPVHREGGPQDEPVTGGENRRMAS